MSRMIALTMLLLIADSPVLADTYRVNYGGNQMPEEQGWEYLWGNEQGYFQGDPPEREIIDYGGNSVLRIETSHDPLNFVTFKWARPDAFDPGPGEVFVMQWGLQVIEVTDPPFDSVVAAHSDEAWSVGFDVTETTVRNSYFPTLSVSIEAGQSHDYTLLSTDMRTYELFIDGELAIEGDFYQGGGGGAYSSWAGWGPSCMGGADIAEWDYFRFGVMAKEGTSDGQVDPIGSWVTPEPIPEPTAVCLMTIGLLACRRATRD
ncbi:MAG: hypothetical protein KKB50_06150 [Planctomycetes bacterium]|nr:hypothetical protein [Planctomycetota bacterium]